MNDEDWQNPYTLSLGLRLAGDALVEVDPRGWPIEDDTLLILLNAYWEPVDFILPNQPGSDTWEVVFDTRDPLPKSGRKVKDGAPYQLEGRSLAVLCAPRESNALQRPQVAQQADTQP